MQGQHWGNQKVNARSGRGLEEYTQTLFQLGAYACILALLALAGRTLLTDMSARAVRDVASAPAVATELPSPARAPAEAPTITESVWLDDGHRLPLRGAVASP